MTRSFDTAEAPHLPAPVSVRGVMLRVLLALLPAIAVQLLWFGVAVLVQLVLAVAFAWLLEAAMLRLRGVAAAPFLRDLSAPLTGVLVALCFPPLTPWWVMLTAMVAAIVVAKHLYGGLGHNLFNPAMVGYAVALICFPRALSSWLDPSAAWPDSSTALAAIFSGTTPVDAIAGATALDSVRSLQLQGLTLGEILRLPALGSSESHRMMLAGAYLAGGLYLLWARIIRWQVPTALIGGLIVLTLPFWLWDADRYGSPLLHLTAGSALCAAFFIATDPVSGCTTPRGRLLFGFGVAAITLAIRRWGSYPDGIAFAVLLMNAAAPWIDLHSRPRYAGEAPPDGR